MYFPSSTNIVFICVSLFVAMRLRWSSFFRLEMYYLRISAIYQLFLKNYPNLWTNQSAGSESPANQRAREPVSVFTHAQGVLWPSFHHRIHTIRRFGGWVFRKFKNEDIGKVFCLASKIKFWWMRGPLHIVQTKQYGTDAKVGERGAL